MPAINLHDIIAKQFGVKTDHRINPETALVQNTVTKILSLNPKRLSFVVVNLSNVSIYIAPRQDVSSTNGILLIANGGSATLKYQEDFEMIAMDWYAIATAPNQNIFLMEVVIQG